MCSSTIGLNSWLLTAWRSVHRSFMLLTGATKEEWKTHDLEAGASSRSTPIGRTCTNNDVEFESVTMEVIVPKSPCNALSPWSTTYSPLIIAIIEMGCTLLIKMHRNWGKIGQRVVSPLGLWAYLCKGRLETCVWNEVGSWFIWGTTKFVIAASCSETWSSVLQHVDFVMFKVIVATRLSTAGAWLLLNASNHTVDHGTMTMARLLGSVGAWLKTKISLETIFHWDCILVLRSGASRV